MTSLNKLGINQSLKNQCTMLHKLLFIGFHASKINFDLPCRRQTNKITKDQINILSALSATQTHIHLIAYIASGTGTQITET